MVYLNLDDDGYLLSVSKTKTSGPRVKSLGDADLSGYRIGAYKWDGETLVFNEDKLAEIEAAESVASEYQEPSQLDRIEAQVVYTAMITDTLLED